MADHGAAWTVSEMASAKALNFRRPKSPWLLLEGCGTPTGCTAIQLFGCEPEVHGKGHFAGAGKGIRFDILDINMGCPAPKITSSGAGSKLLLDPPLCRDGWSLRPAARLGDDTPADGEDAHRLGRRHT